MITTAVVLLSTMLRPSSAVKPPGSLISIESSIRGANAASTERTPRQRRLFSPTDKCRVVLETPDRFESASAFTKWLLENKYHVVDDDDLSKDGSTVTVLLSGEDCQGIHDTAYISDAYDHGVIEGQMQLPDGVVVSFVETEQRDMKNFIQMASDPSFTCMDTAEECAEKPMDEFYGSYQHPDAIYKRLDTLAKEYPTYVQESSMGKTYEDRDQIMHMLTNYDKVGWQNNKKVFYFCATHPREAVALMSCPYIMENLLNTERGSSNSNFDLPNGLLNEITFILLPMLNVDGVYYVHKYNEDIFALKQAMDNGTLDSSENQVIWDRYYNSKMWRKTMKPNTVRCNEANSWEDVGIFETGEFDFDKCIDEYFGVDLNRNYPR